MKHLSPLTPSEVITHGSHTLIHTQTPPGWLAASLGTPGCASPINPGKTELEEPLLLNSLEKLAENSIVWYQLGLKKFEVITTELGKSLHSNCKALND